MDFKLILLLVGMGLLLMVMLYALWGFFGGLKRELKCTAVLLILLLLGWLIYSDPAVIMGANIPKFVTSLFSSLGVEGEAASTWEVILQILQNQVPNGHALFIEGREAYELAYDLVAGVLRGVGLVGITVTMIFLSATVRLVSHIVKLIVAAVKKKKAANDTNAEASAEVSNSSLEEEEPEQVVVLKGIEGADDVLVDVSENEYTPKPVTKRIWGAVVGFVKACVVICIAFVPLSGVVSVLDSASEDTRELVSDLVNGDVQFTEGEENDIVEIIYDFVDDYKKSPLGVVVESSSYFFGDSFSSLLFDATFNFTTDSQKIYLREELISLIEVANALEGNVDYKHLEQSKLEAALDELKDSKLLKEAMPILVEYAYETESFRQMLVNSNQEAAFLQLRYVDWNNDVDVLLDALKVVYTLDVFSEDFNPLTLEAGKVREIAKYLNETELLENAFPIAINVALKLDAVQDLMKDSTFKPTLTNVDWDKELLILVDAYEEFQNLGITSFEGNALDIVLDAIFLNNNEDVAKEIFSDIVHMSLFTSVITPVVERIVDAKFAELNEGQFKSLVGVLPIEKLSASEWESDLHILVDLASEFYDLGVFGFELANMDLTSDKAVQALKNAVDMTFGTLGTETQEARYGLNLLRKDDALVKVIDWAFKNYKIVAPDAELNLGVVNLPKEGSALKSLIDVYAQLVAYPEFDLVGGKIDYIALLEKDNIGELITSALEALVESDIFLNALAPIIDYKVGPYAEKYEAKDILDSVLSNLESEELVEEVKLLVEAVFSARDLGLLAVPGNGLKAIDFSKTDEMKVIINALCDSRIIDGLEARILKVILKIAKIDVELSLLEVDYDNEQELLNAFIDELAPLLQKEEFKVFDENNKLAINPEFLLEKDNVQIIINAIQIIFGDYEQETTGSVLATNLILPVYEQVLKDKIPTDYFDLVDSLKLEELTSEEIANDARILAYVADQLVEFGIYELPYGGTVHFASEFANKKSENILRALADINILEKHPEGILAAIINFAVDMYNKKAANPIEMDRLTAADFEGIVWSQEVNTLVDAFQKALKLLNDNHYTQSGQIEVFITNKSYLSEEFLTVENGNKALDVLESLVQLQVISPIVKAADDYIYFNLLKVGLSLDTLLDLTNEELTQDLVTIVGVARKAVNLGALEYVYNKDVSYIDYEIIASMLYDENGYDLSDLNTLQKHYAQLVSELGIFAIKQFAPNLDFTITPAKLAQLLANIDVVNDAEQLSIIVSTLGEAIHELDDHSLNEVIDFAQSIKSVDDIFGNREIVRNKNVERLSTVLDSLSKLTSLEATGERVFNYAVRKVLVNIDPEFESLRGTLTGAELVSDLASLSTLSDGIISNDLVYLMLGEKVWDLDEEKLTEMFATVFGLNVVNNNNEFVVRYAANKLVSMLKLNNFEFEIADNAFKDFTVSTWVSDQKLLAETLARTLVIAFEDLKLDSVTAVKEFISDKKYADLDTYTTELVEALGGVVSNIFDLETVGVLLNPFVSLVFDYIEYIEINGKEIDLDLHYLQIALENQVISHDMLAEDILTLVEMAVIAINNGAFDLVKDFNNAPLNLAGYKDAVAKLGELNILAYNESHSAKTASALVNAIFSYLGYGFRTSETNFNSLSVKEWRADSSKLGEVVVEVANILDSLGLNTIAEIKAFNFKDYQSYVDDTNIDLAVELAQTLLEFNSGVEFIPLLADYGLPKVANKLHSKEQLVNVEFDFLKGTLTCETLHNDVYVLGQIAKEALAFGAFEYINTKDIQDLELVHIANIVDELANLNLYTSVREEWFVLAAQIATDTTNSYFRLTADDFAEVNFEEDNVKLQALIMKVDELFKANKHNSLSEVVSFFKNFGVTYEQWATDDNAQRLVEIIDATADVDCLVVALASSMDYVVFKALENDIDIRFLYDLPYKGKQLGQDLHSLADVLEQALEFGLVEFVWSHEIQKINLAYVQEIVKIVAHLNIFELAQTDWVALVANKVGAKLGITVSVSSLQFEGVDFEEENQTVVDLLGKLQEALDANKIESTVECKAFIKQQAYLSNQYVTEENAKLVAELLDILADLDILEQLLPGLVSLGAEKLGAQIDGDLTTISANDFDVLAYMVREAIGFGAVEMYNNILWGEKYFYEGDFDLSHLKNIVKSIKDLSVLKVDVAGWAYFVASKFDANLTLEEMQAIDYGKDIDKAIEIIDLADKLMKNTHLTNIVDILNWVEDKGYLSAQYVDDENAYMVAEIIEALSEMQVLVPFANTVYNKVVAKVPHFDYLVGNLTNEEIMSDLSNAAILIKELVSFGTIDLYYYGSCDEFKFEHLHNAVEAFLNLYSLNADRAEFNAIAFNYLAKALGVNAEYVASEFANADWAKDDQVLLDIVDKVSQLADEMNIDSTAQLKQYINGKHYLLAHYTNEITLRYAVDLLELVANIEVLDVVIDEFAAFALDKQNKLDVSFIISGINSFAITGQDLVDDLHTLADLLYDFLDYNLYDIVYSNNYANLDTDKFVEIFVQLDDLNVVNNYRKEWSVLAVNKVLGNYFTISNADLRNITNAMWADEVEDLANIIVAVYEYAVVRGYADNAQINRLYNEIVKQKKYTSERYLVNTFVYGEDGVSEDVVNALMNIVNVSAKSDVVAVVLHKGLDFAIGKVANRGYDLTLLTEYVSVSDLQEDVPLMTEAFVELVMFGAIDLVADKGEIDYNSINRVNRAIELLLDTNLANANSAYVLEAILKDPGAYADSFELRDSIVDIQSLVSNVAYILSCQKLETLRDILNVARNVKSFKFIFNNTFDAQLVAAAQISEVLGQNEVLTQAIISGAKGHLSSKLDQYEGILDIYNIYTSTTLAQDFTSVANAINALSSLELYSIRQSKIVIPYNRVDILSTVLSELMGVHYLNDTGRIQKLVHGIGMYTGADLSNLETMNLDLVSDASLLTNAYEELLVIFNNAKYPYTYVKDLKTAKIDASFVFSKLVVNALKNSYAVFESTTIYQETNGAILILAIPVVKYALPEYYEALNIKNCTIEQLIDDGEILVQIIDTVRKSNLPNALANRSVTLNFTEEKENIEFIAEKLFELRMLDGSFNKLASLILRDFIYGRSIKGTYIPTDSFNVENIEIYNDLVIVSQVADLVVNILQNEGATSVSSIKGLMNKSSMIDLLMNESNLFAIADILDLLTQTTVLQDNAYALWRYIALPVVEAYGYDKYVSYIAASNQELLADMNNAASILRLLVDLEVVDIYNGAIINYDQADEVEELLVLVSQLNYLTYHKETICNFIDSKVSGLGFYGMTSADIDLASEIVKLADVYRAALPILVNSEYPFTTLNQYKYMLRNKTITDKVDLAKAIADEGGATLSVYEELLELELFKYVLVTVCDYLPNNSVTSLLDFSVLTVEELESDLNSIAVILRNASKAGVKPAYDNDKNKLQLSLKLNIENEEEVALIIETITSMYFVNAKFVEIIDLLDSKVSYVDFSQVDFSHIDLVSDGEKLADLAKEFIIICNHTDSFKFKVEQLGDKLLWSTIADVYDELINIDLTKLLISSVVDKYLGKYTPAGKEEAVLNDLGDALHAACDLGIFSNDGVDLSNKAKVSALADALRNTLELPKVVLFAIKYFEDRGSYYGTIPLNYQVADNNAEKQALKEFAKALIAFAKDNASSLNSKDYNALLTDATKQDVKELLTKAYASTVLSRIAGPLTGGTFRALTRADNTRFTEYDSYTLVEMLGGVDAMYHIGNLVVELGILDKTVNLTKTNEMKELITFITTDCEYTKFYCDLFAQYALNKLGFDKNKIDLTVVNYPQEAVVICKVIDDITAALNVPGLNIRNLSSFKNAEFINLAADGLKGLKDSTLFAAYIRDIEKFAINKSGYNNDIIQIVKDRLNDSTYLDSQILADWPIILDIVKAAVTLGVLDGSVALDKPDTLKNVLENAFALSVFENYEESFIRSILKYVDFMDVNTIDFSVIDWSSEEQLFTEFIYRASVLLADDNINGFESINSTVLKNATVQDKVVNFVDAASKSEIGRQVFPTIYNTYILPVLPADYQDFIDFDDPGYTSDKWTNDFEKLLDVFTELDEAGYGTTTFNPTFNNLLNVYDAVFGVNGLNGIYATSKNPQYWMNELIYKNLPTIGYFVPTPSNVSDWESEVGLVRKILVQFALLSGSSTSLSDFNTKSIYQNQNVIDIFDTLKAIKDSQSMQSLLVAVINDAVNTNTDSSSSFVLSDYISSDFAMQTISGHIYYEASYWTESELADLAYIVALMNALYGNSKVTFDFTNIARSGDITSAGVNSDGTVDTTKVGYYHVLYYMAKSKTFDLSSLNTLIKTQFGTFIGTDDEIVIGSITTPDKVTNLFKTLKKLNEKGIDFSNNITESLYSLGESETTAILNILNNSVSGESYSNELKPLAPYVLKKLITYVASKKATSSGTILDDEEEIIYSHLSTDIVNDLNSYNDGITNDISAIVSSIWS